jgi:hypothetical protein
MMPVQSKHRVACGWIIVFLASKQELEKFYVNLGSGPGQGMTRDLGFPVAIENGQIKSTLNRYASGILIVCPSI